MDVRVEYVPKKNSSALLRDDHVLLRISTYLSASEQKRHIEALTSRIERKLIDGQLGTELFFELYTQSRLTFFMGDTYTFGFAKDILRGMKCVGHTVFFKQIPGMHTDFISLHEALDEGMITKKEVLGLMYTFAKKYLHDEVKTIVEEWVAYMHPKRALADVCIKNVRSRWGSCSSTGVVTLSLRSLVLPCELFESVCVHEVAHLSQMNHSKKFWDIVLSVMPDYYERRAEMKKFR